MQGDTVTDLPVVCVDSTKRVAGTAQAAGLSGDVIRWQVDRLRESLMEWEPEDEDARLAVAVAVAGFVARCLAAPEGSALRDGVLEGLNGALDAGTVAVRWSGPDDR